MTTDLQRHLQELNVELEPDLAPVDPTDDPRAQREFHFTLNEKMPNGKPYRGEFISTIPTLGDRLKISRLAARLRGAEGVNVSTEGFWISETVALLQVCLKVVDAPWAANFLALEDERLLGKLHTEVVGHHRIYFRYSEDQGQSPEAAQKAE